MEVGRSIGPYEIRGVLGSGGMGAVYRALDTRLEREVAIKVVPERLVEDPQAMGRLKREARLLASVSHPNVATIYGLEEYGDGPFLVLELVEGKTLQALLADGALPWERGLKLMCQVVDAIETAHHSGVIHRDLKPANIVVGRKDLVKVLDFGLAKIQGEAQPSDEARTMSGSDGLTVAGMLLGTVPYMSPEQVRGQPVDASTDVWAFGCVMYETLTGEPPFSRQTQADTISAILREEPDWSALPEGLPWPLHDLLARCLRRDRDRRLAEIGEAGEVLERCRQPSSGGLAVSSGAFAPSPVQEADEPSIAVLPFVNMSADPDNEYFSDGLAEELIHALAKLGGIQVAARTSCFQFKGKAADVRQIGRDLGVDAVLEGSVRKAGNRVRVSAQLVDVSDGYQLWSERFDREIQDVFAIQDEIATAIVEELEVELTRGPGEPLVVRYTENLDAYTLYMKGRYYWEQRYEGGLEKAIDHFRRAIELDPEHALAHAGLADAHWSIGMYQLRSPEQVFPQAEASAKRALEIDNELAEAHTSLAVVRYLFDWDWSASEEEFLRAIELDPRYPAAHGYFAILLASLKREEEALAHARSAQDLDPFSDYAISLRAFTLTLLGRPDEAIDACRRALDIDPRSFLASWTLGWSYDRAGRYEEAIDVLSRVREQSGDIDSIVALLAHAQARAGLEAPAREALQHLREQAEARFVSAALLGWVHEGLGEAEAAREAMERAYEARAHPMNFLMFGPFREQLEGMGLPVDDEA